MSSITDREKYKPKCLMIPNKVLSTPTVLGYRNTKDSEVSIIRLNLHGVLERLPIGTPTWKQEY
jgi:hypothetical protein